MEHLSASQSCVPKSIYQTPCYKIRLHDMITLKLCQFGFGISFHG
jgi:hypothetical protein